VESSTKSIDILMATYNGEKFLTKQIESLLGQTFENWHLSLRDDGSTDRTVEILNKYKNQFPDKITIVEDKKGKLGACLNFGELLKYAKANYIIFCDQDDVWLADKIRLTLKKIKLMEKTYGRDVPILVHTDLIVVDENLNVLHKSLWKYQKLIPNLKDLNRLLVQNIVTGCTTMINKSLRELSVPIPEEAIAHDWWLTLVASAFGKIDYIKQPTILYRQHEKNDMGAEKWGIGNIINKTKNFYRTKAYFHRTMVQAASFFQTFKSKLNSHNLDLVYAYSTLGQRNFLDRRFVIIKNKYYKIGFFRNTVFFMAV
jgi:glycosyltransferase involved in cell wall biosynthesis